MFRVEIRKILIVVEPHVPKATQEKNIYVHKTRMHDTKCRYHKNARSSAGKNNNTAHVASWPKATHHDSINCRDHRLKDVHRHNRRRHRHHDNDDYDGGHRDDDGDDDERNVREKLCTLH